MAPEKVSNSKDKVSAAKTAEAAPKELLATRKATSSGDRKKELVRIYSNMKKVPIVLAPQYAAHFGNIMRVSINGISIAVRVDGSTQKVPEIFADEISRRRKQVNIMLMRMKRMANIPKNAEEVPGQLII